MIETPKTDPISSSQPPVLAARSWIGQLYYYVAALIGLVFLIVGFVMLLLGVKQAAFPGLGQSDSYLYSGCPFSDSGRPTECTEAEKDTAEKNSRDDRRDQGANQAVDGVLIAMIGAPVLVWHLRQTRRPASGPHP